LAESAIVILVALASILMPYRGDANSCRDTRRLCPREKPASLVSHGRGDTLELDARHFQDVSWEEVSFADWRDYSDAVAGMNADAFCYFLPSIMSLSLGGLDGAALAGDNLIGLLDTSSDPHLWHEFFVESFQNLNADEL
jgi:hypothetical protein